MHYAELYAERMPPAVVRNLGRAKLLESRPTNEEGCAWPCSSRMWKFDEAPSALSASATSDNTVRCSHTVTCNLIDQGNPFFNRNDVHWLLSFTSRLVVDRILQGPVLDFVVDVYLRRRSALEAALDRLSTPHVLSHTSVVLSYHDGDKVLSRCIAGHHFQWSPWGISELRSCVLDEDCLRRPGELTGSWKTVKWYEKKENGDKRLVKDPHGSIRFQCFRCKKQSGWIRRPDWIVTVPHYPLAYHFAWPIDEGNLASLIGAIKSSAVPLTERKEGNNNAAHTPSSATASSTAPEASGVPAVGVPASSGKRKHKGHQGGGRKKGKTGKDSMA